MSHYITIKRMRGMGINKTVNIPCGTVLQADDEFIYYEGNPVCAIHSQRALDHFACDDDGYGLVRGRLTTEIIRRLTRRDQAHEDRWNKIWADPLCGKYRRPDYSDYWLWDHSFFAAPICDLRYIAWLAGAKHVT